MSVEVVSVGRVNVDVVLRVESLTQQDRHLTSQDGYISFGGSAANFATQSAKLGVKTGLLCCIGNDLYGQLVLRELSRIGVDTRFILSLDRQSTGIFTYIYDQEGHDVVVVEAGANKFLEKQLLDESAIEGVRTIHVAGAFPMMTKRAAEIATVNGMVLSLDPGRAAGSLDYASILPYTDLLFVNEKELQDYFHLGTTEPEIRGLARSFPGILVVKRGPKGALATDGFEYYTSPAFDVKVVDTMGAGDAFAAAFVTAWTRSEKIEQALNVANAAAAIAITVRGAQEGQPTMEETARFLGKYGVSIDGILRTFRS
jgi:ribokinase